MKVAGFAVEHKKEIGFEMREYQSFYFFESILLQGYSLIIKKLKSNWILK